MTLNRLCDIPLENVHVTDAYEANAFTQTVEYLLRLEPERFLHAFYVHAGLAPKTATGYGGWERGEGQRLQGHFFGHYVSALAQAYASSEGATAESLLMRLRTAVYGLQSCQSAYAVSHPLDAGYVSAFSIELLPSGGDGLLVPFYCLHKLLAGLLHAHRFAPPALASEALAIAEGFGTWLNSWAARQDNPATILATEYGGMNDALYELYRITRDPAHRRAAEYFDELPLFESLAAGDDVLDGLHANATIPKLVGALKRYTVLAEYPDGHESLSKSERAALDTYRAAAENFWRMVTESHSYANGGNSQAEHFHAPMSLHRFATNGVTDGYGENSTSEGCNAYNMLKLTRELFQLTGDSRYADYYESTLTNSILASQNPLTGMVTYFQPMAAGYAKVFGGELDEFWCDQGTALESFTKLGDSVYFADASGLWVTQFRSSEVVDHARNLRLTQKADVPSSELVRFQVEAIDGTEVADRTALHIRLPHWAVGKPQLAMNGIVLDIDALIDHGWITLPLHAGALIEYRLQSEVEVVEGTENPNWIAFRYGPVLLAAELSRNGVGETYEAGVLVRMSKAATLDSNVMVADTAIWKSNVTAHLVRESNEPNGNGIDTMRFSMRDVDEQSQKWVLEPYYSLFGARYSVYFTLMSALIEN